jgi:methylglutaconyl-CoA hydratase
MYETIDVDVVNSVASVTLNRPEVRNAFNARMIAEISDAFAELSVHPDVRVIVLSGHGSSFSAGADISWMRASLDLGVEENVVDAERMWDMFAAIDTTPQPVIARIHGAALGGGMGLASCCDVVVASDGARFGFTEVKLGIIPAVISYFVLRKVGASWARALFVTGERFDAKVARDIHLVHRITPEDELNDAVAEKVTEILSSGPEAVKAAKALVDDLHGISAQEARSLTARRIAELRASPEGQEGLKAFLEKRGPSWRNQSQ